MPDDTTTNAILPEPFLQLIEDRIAGARFHEVAHIRDPDGVLGVVTERVSDGKHSFAFFREFERDGQTQRSTYLAHRHIPAMRRVLSRLDRELEAMEDRARQSRRMRAAG
jgi:hypothetical protein